MSELDGFRDERETMTARVSELQTALRDHQQVTNVVVWSHFCFTEEFLEATLFCVY